MRGFTLIEVLVTISIIGILISLLLPAVQSARAAARRTQCQSQLHQLGLALHNYHDAVRSFPPGSLTVGPAFRQLSGWGWGAMLLPYVEQTALYEQIDFHIGTAVGSNREVIREALPFWICPADASPARILASIPDEGTVVVTAGNYCGVEPALTGMSKLRVADVTDGLSQTLFVGERVYQPVLDGSLEYTSSWCGRVATEQQTIFQSVPHLPATAQHPINESLRFPLCFSSRHTGGAQFLFGDGAVRLLNESIDRDVYAALGTPGGGESVSF
ncbi:MAG: DUF1559 domain-containing protein [Planctomycetaceae bacterium]